MTDSKDGDLFDLLVLEKIKHLTELVTQTGSTLAVVAELLIGLGDALTIQSVDTDIQQRIEQIECLTVQQRLSDARLTTFAESVIKNHRHQQELNAVTARFHALTVKRQDDFLYMKGGVAALQELVRAVIEGQRESKIEVSDDFEVIAKVDQELRMKLSVTRGKLDALWQQVNSPESSNPNNGSELPLFFLVTKFVLSPKSEGFSDNEACIELWYLACPLPFAHSHQDDWYFSSHSDLTLHFESFSDAEYAIAQYGDDAMLSVVAVNPFMGSASSSNE